MKTGQDGVVSADSAMNILLDTDRAASRETCHRSHSGSSAEQRSQTEADIKTRLKRMKEKVKRSLQYDTNQKLVLDRKTKQQLLAHSKTMLKSRKDKHLEGPKTSNYLKQIIILLECFVADRIL